MQIVAIRGAVKSVYHDRLGRATAWIGNNSTGKTSRFEGFDLALSGKRLEGKPEDVIPPGHTSASVAVEWLNDAGQPCLSTFDSRSEWTQIPGAPVIVRPLSWLLHLGPNRAREEVVNRWGGEDVQKRLIAPETLTTDQRKIWDQGLKDVVTQIEEDRAKAIKKGRIPEVSADPTTLLAELQSWARKEKLRRGADLRAFEDLLEAQKAETSDVVSATGVVYSEADVQALEAKHAEALAWERSASARAQWAKLETEFVTYSARVAAFQALPALEDLSQTEAEIADYKARSAELTTKATTLYQLMQAIQADTVRCPCCGTVEFDAQSAYNTLAEHYQRLYQSIEAINVNLDALDTHVNTVKTEEKRREVELAAITQEYNRIMRDSELLRAQIPATPYTGKSSADISLELQKVRSAVAISTAREKDANRKYELETARNNAKAVEVASGQVLATLVREISGALSSALDAALPSTLRGRFHFDIESCRFMMVGADGRPHAWREQGEAEYTALTIALARAWAGTPHCLLLLSYARDLAAFDPDTLAYVLADLSDAAHRGDIAMVGVESPTTLPLDHTWTVIRTFEQAQAAPTPSIAAPTPVEPEQPVPVIPLPVPQPPVAPALPPPLSQLPFMQPKNGTTGNGHAVSNMTATAVPQATQVSAPFVVRPPAPPVAPPPPTRLALDIRGDLVDDGTLEADEDDEDDEDTEMVDDETPTPRKKPKAKAKPRSRAKKPSTKRRKR